MVDQSPLTDLTALGKVTAARDTTGPLPKPAKPTARGRTATEELLADRLADDRWLASSATGLVPGGLRA